MIGCPYEDECGAHLDAMNPFLEGVGKEGRRPMIIGDSPSYFEDCKATLFGTAIGKQLYEELRSRGLKMEDCYLTKAIKCYSPEYKKDHKVACKKRLLEEIKAVNPTVILLLGGLALEVLTGKKNISKVRGTIFHVEGVPVIPTFNPGASIHRPEIATEYYADLDYFVRLAKTGGLTSVVEDDFNFIPVYTISKLRELHARIVTEECWYSYDIETQIRKHPSDGLIFMIGIGFENGDSYVIPWDYEEALTEPMYEINLTPHIVISFLNSIFAKNRRTVGQYVKYDNRWLRDRGIKPYIAFDTFLAAYTINVSTPHGLKFLARTKCGADNYNEDIEFKDTLTPEEFKRMMVYCGKDVYYTIKLKPILEEELMNGVG